MKNYGKIASALIGATMVLGIMGVTAFAAERTQRTEELNLQTDEYKIDQSNEDEGWSWDADTATLTLDSVDFSVNNGGCIKIPYDRDVTFILNGENNLKTSGLSGQATIYSYSYDKDCAAKLIIKGEGILNMMVDTTEMNFEYPVIDVVNLILEEGTINAEGGAIMVMNTIEIKGGTCNVKNTPDYGLYAVNEIKISSGEVNVEDVESVGMFVTGATSYTMSEEGILITGGNIKVSGKTAAMYTGSNIYDGVKDIIIMIGDDDKIEILDSKFGIYVNNGDIKIQNGNIKFDNVNEPIKMKDESEGNIDIEKADYSKIEELIESIPENLDEYTEESVENLKKALEAVEK